MNTLHRYLRGWEAINKRDGGILTLMNEPILEPEKVLLIDACGATSGVAVSEGMTILAKEDLPRAGSAEIIAAVARVLESANLKLQDLDAVGVVNGPGSFTGVRVGLSAAKGLCESSSVQMIAVSRLQVLADAVGLTTEMLALDAGRGEFYLCELVNGETREWLGTADEVIALGQGRRIIVTEEKTAEKLSELTPVLHPLHAEDALPSVLKLLRSGAANMTLVDANYLRREGDIYKKPSAVSARIDV
jgi:tRNA threonylcarbamoyladenosine biosynthesis protein TsaB